MTINTNFVGLPLPVTQIETQSGGEWKAVEVLQEGTALDGILKNENNFLRTVNDKKELFISRVVYDKIDLHIAFAGALESAEKEKKSARKQITLMVAERISSLVDQYQIPFPLFPYTEGEVYSDFNKLQNFSPLFKDLIFDTKTTKGDFKNHDYGIFSPHLERCNENLFSKRITASLIGQKMGNKFQSRVRFSAGSIDGGAIGKWNVPNQRVLGLMALFNNKHFPEGDVKTNNVRNVFTRRFDVTNSDFLPITVKAVISLLEHKFQLDTGSGIRILDTSSGWGARLVGALADQRVTHYTGTDPNEALVSGYNKIQEFYNTMRSQHPDDFTGVPPKTISMLQKPSEELEDLDFPAGCKNFDLLLTSPPYFNREKYSWDASQSWIRYKKIDDWLNNYLFETLNRAYRHVKPGGFFAINIADINNSRGRTISICEPMLKFLTEGPPKLTYLGCVAYTVGTKKEPMWLLRKDLNALIPAPAPALRSSSSTQHQNESRERESTAQTRKRRRKKCDLNESSTPMDEEEEPTESFEEGADLLNNVRSRHKGPCLH